MGQIAIGESGLPATPGEGVVLYPSVATPSIFKMVDDAGAVYTFALLEKTQTFTKTQTVSPTSTAQEGIVIDMPASTAFQALKINYNGTQRQQAYTDATTNRYYIYGVDGGAGTGSYIVLARNTNAGTPAAGFVQMENRAGTTYYLWVDSVGKLRVGTTAPTNANDATGTIVGTQT
jgi:hypothetical protein